MKKLLLSMFSVLLGLGVSAQTEVKFDFDTNATDLFGIEGRSSGQGTTAVTDGDITTNAVATLDGVTVTVSPSTTSTPNRLWNASPVLRVYGGTITVSAGDHTISKIAFFGNSKFNMTAKPGTLDTNAKEWTPAEGVTTSVVVFTIGSNTQLKSLTVYLDGAAPDEPEITVGTGAGTLESPYDAVRANAYALAGSTATVYVQGKISSISEFSASYGNASYYLSSDGETTSEQFYVYRGMYYDGAKFTSEDQIAVGDEVIVKGTLGTYNEAPQLAAGSSIVSINGVTTPPAPEYTDCATLAAVKALAKGTAFRLTCEPVVVFKAGNYSYIYDGTDYALVYGSISLKAGDVVKSGATGSVDIYNNLIELIPTEFEANGTGTIPTPEKVIFDDIMATMTAANQALYIAIDDVVCDATWSNKNITGKVTVEGETVEINLYNRFSLGDITPGTFNVEGFIAVYNETVQLYVSSMVDPNAEVYVPVGDGTAEKPFTVADIKNGAEGSNVWVVGYMVGTVGSAFNEANVKFEAGENASETNFVLADAADVNNYNQTIPVALPSGDIRTALNLKANVDNLGRKVYVKGTITNYFNVRGVKPLTEYSFDQPSAVNAIEVENANQPVEYFNLQGQRVENPANGLYIRRQGNTAVKVIL